MKIFSDAKTLNPASARNCLLLNQFATPGLGSLMGGRFVAGLGQLFLFLIGFAIFMYWFIKTMKVYYSLMSLDSPDVQPAYGKFLIASLLLCAASWLWSLLTSLSLMRQAKIQEPPPPGTTPPRINSLPPKI